MKLKNFLYGLPQFHIAPWNSTIILNPLLYYRYYESHVNYQQLSEPVMILNERIDESGTGYLN